MTSTKCYGQYCFLLFGTGYRKWGDGGGDRTEPRRLDGSDAKVVGKQSDAIDFFDNEHPHKNN